MLAKPYMRPMSVVVSGAVIRKVNPNPSDSAQKDGRVLIAHHQQEEDDAQREGRGDGDLVADEVGERDRRAGSRPG